MYISQVNQMGSGLERLMEACLENELPGRKSLLQDAFWGNGEELRTVLISPTTTWSHLPHCSHSGPEETGMRLKTSEMEGMEGDV